MNASTVNTFLNNDLLSQDDQYVEQYEKQFTSTKNWLEQIKYVFSWIQKIRLWKILGEVVRGIGCVLLASAPEQEKIEAARIKAMHYRGIF